MTRAALLALGAALLAAAGTLPSPALLAPAAGLGVLVAGAWTSVVLAARRARVARDVLTSEAIEGAPIVLRFRLRDLGRLPVRIEARVGDDAWAALAQGTTDLALTVGRRGAYRLVPTTVRVRDALGIAERRLRVGRPEALLVLPRPDGGAAARRPWSGPADDVDLDGLTPYVPGTPIGRIHWPTLARGAGLHARRIAHGADALPLVVLEARATAGADALDWAARVAAGHIEALALRGGCRVLLPGDRGATTVAGGEQWRAVHRRLALVAPHAEPSPAAPPGAVRVDAARAPAGARPPAPDPPDVERAT